MVGGFISWGASRAPLAKVHTTTTYNKYQEQVTNNPAHEFMAWKPRKHKWTKSMALAGSKLKRWSITWLILVQPVDCYFTFPNLLWRLLSPLPAVFLMRTLPRMLLLHVLHTRYQPCCRRLHCLLSPVLVISKYMLICCRVDDRSLRCITNADVASTCRYCRRRPG